MKKNTHEQHKNNGLSVLKQFLLLPCMSRTLPVGSKHSCPRSYDLFGQRHGSKVAQATCLYSGTDYELQLLIFFSNWHCKPMHDRKVNRFTFGPCSLKLIITNPGFNFNLGPYFFCQKVLSLLILTCFTWNTLYYNIVGENNLWELYITILRSDLNSNFLRILGYLNPHLSEQAQEIWPKNPLWS